MVEDVEIDSNATVNRGTSNTMVLGVNSLGTGQSRILMEYDLSNIPWPSAMTPTQMMLRMYQPGRFRYLINHHRRLSVQWFTESSVIWATAPSCSTSEITRSTLTLNNPFGLDGMGFDQPRSKQHRQRQHHDDVHAVHGGHSPVLPTVSTPLNTTTPLSPPHLVLGLCRQRGRHCAAGATGADIAGRRSGAVRRKQRSAQAHQPNRP